jgi:pyrroloquinoline quinone (PQQ) biosynthesis protein C/mannose-6-phosphate isomerase-like protein (cupin superfamily)
VSVTEGFQRRHVETVLPKTVEIELAKLRAMQAEHRFWRNPLLEAFAQGTLTLEDLKFVFSQYHLYSKNFTRFVAAVMANCDSDLFRAQLSENLWEEGGGCEPDRRHAQIFRNFLRNSLGVADAEAIDYASFTRHFVREYLVQCLRSEPMVGTAFLSLGTEGIVHRLYETMLVGLRKAGLAETQLEFFHIHIACDDEHAVTLERMMASYAGEQGWFDACLQAMNRALDLRTEFFTNIFEALHERRLEPMMSRLQARRSLAEGVDDELLCHRAAGAGTPLYANEVEKLNVKFTVERLPLQAEVLDPRTVRIPAGKFNEKHKHAHETLIHILEGAGQVVIDDRVLPVGTGDTVIVPRWAMHQTQNTGRVELKFLAVTDFNFTQRAYRGDATDYRIGADADAIRRRG